MSNQLTIEEVQKIANLAKLDLDQEELEEQSKSLSAILGYIKKLEELDTEGVKPLTGPLDLQNVLRADEPQSSSDQLLNKIKANYPDFEDTAIKVPKMSA